MFQNSFLFFLLFFLFLLRKWKVSHNFYCSKLENGRPDSVPEIYLWVTMDIDIVNICSNFMKLRHMFPTNPECSFLNFHMKILSLPEHTTSSSLTYFSLSMYHCTGFKYAQSLSSKFSCNLFNVPWHYLTYFI